MSTGQTIWVITFCVLGAIGVALLIQGAVAQTEYEALCTELDGVAIHADDTSYCIKREALLHTGQK